MEPATTYTTQPGLGHNIVTMNIARTNANAPPPKTSVRFSTAQPFHAQKKPPVRFFELRAVDLTSALDGHWLLNVEL